MKLHGKITLLILCAAMLLTCVGCSDTKTTETTADTAAEQTLETIPERLRRIHFHPAERLYRFLVFLYPDCPGRKHRRTGK